MACEDSTDAGFLTDIGAPGGRIVSAGVQTILLYSRWVAPVRSFLARRRATTTPAGAPQDRGVKKELPLHVSRSSRPARKQYPVPVPVMCRKVEKLAPLRGENHPVSTMCSGRGPWAPPRGRGGRPGGGHRPDQGREGHQLRARRPQALVEAHKGHRQNLTASERSLMIPRERLGEVRREGRHGRRVSGVAVADAPRAEGRAEETEARLRRKIRAQAAAPAPERGDDPQALSPPSARR